MALDRMDENTAVPATRGSAKTQNKQDLKIYGARGKASGSHLRAPKAGGAGFQY